MNIVLLSGGSGKRLWPLSNDVRSKQFVKLFKKADGTYQSMVQRVYSQIKSVDKEANVTIATSKAQVSAIHNQLGDEVGICVEPCRRDTFPAIALATAYLHYIKGISEEETVVVCPVDPLVDNDYFEALRKLGELAETRDANLVLMGIEPTYPSEKYGYIIPISSEDVSKVNMFKEKPNCELAKEYIEHGALWNGGVFAYRVGYLLNKAHELIDFTDYNDLLNKYETLTKISFDYAVVEQEDNIDVMRFQGQWKDLGTWNTLAESMCENILGNGIINETCENVHILNELNIPVLCMGIRDIVVAASPEGVLISNKDEADKIKSIVDTFDNDIKFAEKSWGTYQVLDDQDYCKTIKLDIKHGKCMTYHCHQYRDEIWNVIKGSGKVIIDDKELFVNDGDVINIKAGSKHTIVADTSMSIIEIQLGKDINVKDKQKFMMD